MKEIRVRLGTMDDVKNFVKTVSQFTTDIDLISDRYVIDAKSILGIFSLDLNKPLLVSIESDEEAPAVTEALEAFIVRE